MQDTRIHGWAAGAAVLLLVVGLFNVLQGWLALVQSEFFAVAAGDLIFLNFAAWGIVLGVWGLLMVIAGIAVFTGQVWARALGVVLAGVNILAQLLFLVAFPLWSLAAVAINVVIIYGLTAGFTAESSASALSAYRAGQSDAQAAPREGAPAGAERSGTPAAEQSRPTAPRQGGPQSASRRGGAHERQEG